MIEMTAENHYPMHAFIWAVRCHHQCATYTSARSVFRVSLVPHARCICRCLAASATAHRFSGGAAVAFVLCSEASNLGERF